MFLVVFGNRRPIRRLRHGPFAVKAASVQREDSFDTRLLFITDVIKNIIYCFICLKRVHNIGDEGGIKILYLRT